MEMNKLEYKSVQVLNLLVNGNISDAKKLMGSLSKSSRLKVIMISKEKIVELELPPSIIWNMVGWCVLSEFQ